MHAIQFQMGVPSCGVLMIKILLFRVLYQGPLFSESPESMSMPEEGSRRMAALSCRSKK